MAAGGAEALRLGDIEDFPFVEPPDRRNVRDGIALLEDEGLIAAIGVFSSAYAEWQKEQEANKALFADDFVTRQEFKDRYKRELAAPKTWTELKEVADGVVVFGAIQPVGGDAPSQDAFDGIDIARAQPAFAAMGETIVHVGAPNGGEVLSNTQSSVMAAITASTS